MLIAKDAYGTETILFSTYREHVMRVSRFSHFLWDLALIEFHNLARSSSLIFLLSIGHIIYLPSPLRYFLRHAQILLIIYTFRLFFGSVYKKISSLVTCRNLWLNSRVYGHMTIHRIVFRALVARGPQSQIRIRLLQILYFNWIRMLLGIPDIVQHSNFALERGLVQARKR